MSLLLLFNSSADVPVVEIPSEITNRPFFAWGNLANNATCTGGSWTDGLPLSNLRNRKQARAARSTSADPAASQFVQPTGGEIWRVVSLVAHNISLDGLWRVTAGADATVSSPTYDSGWMQTWPAVYETADLEWDQDNFWSGQYSAAEMKGLNPTAIHRPPYFRSEPYVKIEINDQGNVYSFIQIGRFFIANGWTATSNILVGATFGVSDDSGVQESWTGAEVFTEKRRRREASIELAPMEDAEAYGKAFEMMRQAGVSGEVLFQWSGTDTKLALQRQFLCRMPRLSPIQHPYPFHRSVAFAPRELF